MERRPFVVGNLETKPDTAPAWFAIAMVAALFVWHLVWVMRGHSTEWFSWTLLLMVASSAAHRLALAPRWRLPLRLVYIASAVATVAGLLFAVIHDAIS